MSKTMQGRAAASLFYGVLLTACAGCSLGTSIANIGHEAVVQIPYVQSVTAVAPLVQGQAGQLTVHLSMDANPGVLASQDYMWGAGGMTDPNNNEQEFTPFLQQFPGAGPQERDLTVNVIPLQAGQFKLRVGTTTTEALGGTSIKTQVTSTFVFPLGRGPFEHREFTFPVAAP